MLDILKTRVRVHAANKKTDTGGRRETPQCISQAFDALDIARINAKVIEYEELGGESTEMLVEIIPIGEVPSWEK